MDQKTVKWKTRPYSVKLSFSCWTTASSRSSTRASGTGNIHTVLLLNTTQLCRYEEHIVKVLLEDLKLEGRFTAEQVL